MQMNDAIQHDRTCSDKLVPRYHNSSLLRLHYINLSEVGCPVQSGVTELTDRWEWPMVGLLAQLAALVARHIAVEVDQVADQVAGHLPVNPGQK